MSKQHTIFSWNVNGIRAVIRKGAFEQFLTQYSPDILCLQETKANKDQVEIDLPDYTEYWNSADKKGYSGTAIFSKTEPLSVTYGISPTTDFMDEEGRDAATEGRVVTAEFEHFFVVTVYTPNAKDDLSRIPLRYNKWDKDFLAHCKKLEKKKPVVFCGDLNVAHKEIDLARPKENQGKKGFTQEERERFQDFLDAGFIDTFRLKHGDIPDQYSWWSAWGGARERNVGWRIDYVLVSEALQSKVKEAVILQDVMGSDHCPVGVTLVI